MKLLLKTDFTFNDGNFAGKNVSLTVDEISGWDQQQKVPPFKDVESGPSIKLTCQPADTFFYLKIVISLSSSSHILSRCHFRWMSTVQKADTPANAKVTEVGSF